MLHRHGTPHAAVAIALLSLLAPLSGCVAPPDDEREDSPRRRADPEGALVRLSWPVPGSVATYRSEDAEVRVVVGHDATIRPYGADAIETRALHIEARTRPEEVAVRTEFLDAAGSKVLVASACPLLSMSREASSAECHPKETIAYSVVEAGTPGFFGAGLLWSAEPPTAPRTFRIFGESWEWRATATALSKSCSRVELAAPPPESWAANWFIAEAGGIGTSYDACAGEAFPRAIETATLGRLELVSFVGGPGAEPPSGRAQPLDDRPVHPAARPPEGPLPYAEREGPGVLSVPEAYETLLGDDVAADWFDDHPAAFLHVAGPSGSSSGGALVLRLESETVVLKFVDAKGDTLRAEIEKECTQGICDRHVRAVDVASAPPPRPLLHPNVGYATAAARAEWAGGGEPASLTIARSWGGRPPLGDESRYYYLFGGWGTPPVLVDGRSGEVAYAAVADPDAARATGLTREMLRPPS